MGGTLLWGTYEFPGDSMSPIAILYQSILGAGS